MFEENCNHNKRMFLIRMSRNLSIILVCYVLCETLSMAGLSFGLFHENSRRKKLKHKSKKTKVKIKKTTKLMDFLKTLKYLKFSISHALIFIKNYF